MSQLIYRLVETAPPASEPLDLADVKTFMRVDQSDDDAMIGGLISTAREFCEAATGRSLITRSYSLFIDRWPQWSSVSQSSLNRAGWWDGMREGVDVIGDVVALCLPKPPLLSVVQINVYAADDSSVVFPASSYFVDTAGTPGRVVITQGTLPPMLMRMANGIEIQFTAGYGATGNNVPPLLRQGMRQVIAHLYEHRGDSQDQALLVSGAAAIFRSYRVMGMS